MTKEQQIIISRINSLCEERDMSLYVLAYKSSVPLTTLTHIMSGTTKNPGIFTVAKLCDGFEMSMKEFFDTEDFEELMREMSEE